jgi:hypothetical protein
MFNHYLIEKDIEIAGLDIRKVLILYQGINSGSTDAV